MNKKGFTLVEILTAVIIVAILTVMAVPLYEKTIERSHMAEARTLMNRLQAAKLAAMEKMNCTNYSYDADSASCPRLEHLGVAFIDKDGHTATGRSFETKNFKYSLGAVGDTRPNGICAKRTGGEYKDTEFMYYGLRQDEGEAEFKCKGTYCQDYGFATSDILSTLKCTFE